ncbi:MAG: GumC family protein, partial [Armatimonadota bacterium]
ATLGDQPPPTRWPDEWQALLDTLTIAPVEESEIIEVRCEAADAERARDFTNALVLAYLGRSLADARATTRRTRSYVEQQLSDVEVRLAEAEESLRQFGERVGTVALDESARQQVGLLVRLNEQAAIAESTLNSQKALRDELEAELSAVDERVIASTVTRRNPEIMALQEELARTEAERASLLEEYAPESLPVRRATAGVEDLRARLRETAVEVVDSRQESINPLAQEIAQEMIVAEGEQMAAEQSMRVLRGAAARAESELSGLPAEQVALLRLQREIELLERFYLALKEKQQEFEISERMKAPASRLISHAIASDEPARPKKLLTIAGGLVAGLLLGLLTVGLAEQLDERMQDPQHVATVLGVPVIGVLAGRGRESEGESAEEALRSIRQHVRALSRGSTGANVLVVASDGDAGVRVAEGLARVAREQGERAIILARGEHASEIEAELTAALSPQAETDVVEPPGGASGADLIVVATQSSAGLSGAAALLEAGYPVAVVVDIDRTSAAVASGLAELARRHGAGPVVAVVTGGRRSAACYLTRKTRT